MASARRAWPVTWSAALSPKVKYLITAKFSSCVAVSWAANAARSACRRSWVSCSGTCCCSEDFSMEKGGHLEQAGGWWRSFLLWSVCTAAIRPHRLSCVWCGSGICRVAVLCRTNLHRRNITLEAVHKIRQAQVLLRQAIDQRFKLVALQEN
jgi:hypothetical protein